MSGSLLAASQHFFFITLDLQAVVTDVNNCFLEQTGYPATKCKGTSFVNLVAPQNQPLVAQTLQHLACKGLPGKTMGLPILHSKKHWLDTCWEFAPLLSASGQLTGFQGIGYLLSPPNQKQKIEEPTEPDQPQRILQALFDSTSHVQFFVAPDYRLLFFNRQACENARLYHHRELKIGDNMLAYAKETANEVENRFIAEFNRALQGEVVMVESEIAYQKSVSHFFLSEYVPVYDQGELLGIAISIWDISQRKKQELQVEKQHKMLAHIAHLQSHQTRQPVSTLLGLLSIINRQELSADNEKLFTLMELTTRKLDTVIHEMVATVYAPDQHSL